MQQFIRNGIVCVLLLSAVFCRAEKAAVTHEFSTMNSNGTLVYPPKSDNPDKPDYTIGKTDLLIYTCSGTNATFGGDLYNDLGYKKISINLPSSNRFVTTTAIDSLTEIQIWHYPMNTCTNIKVQLSRDSVHWVNMTGATTYETDHVRATFVPGRYYVRVRNTSSTSVSLWKIKYTFGDCNCVMYIPEN